MTLLSDKNVRRVRNFAWALLRTHSDLINAVLKSDQKIDVINSLLKLLTSASMLDPGLARDIQTKLDFKPLAKSLSAVEPKAKRQRTEKNAPTEPIRKTVVEFIASALDSADDVAQRAAFTSPLMNVVARSLYSQSPDVSKKLVQGFIACPPKLLLSPLVLKMLYDLVLVDSQCLNLLKKVLRSHAVVVAPLLTAMMDPTEDERLVPLGLECARILGTEEFFKTSRLSLEPRVSPVWVSHACFTCSVLGLDFEPSKQLDVALAQALPSFVSRVSLSRGLQSPNGLVSLECLSLVEQMLHRCVRAASQLTPDDRLLFLAEVTKRVPDASILIGLRASGSKQQTNGGRIDIWCRALQVLAAYFELSPTFAETDLLKFMPRHVSPDAPPPEAFSAFVAFAYVQAVLCSKPQPDDWLKTGPVVGSLVNGHSKDDESSNLTLTALGGMFFCSLSTPILFFFALACLKKH